MDQSLDAFLDQEEEINIPNIISGYHAYVFKINKIDQIHFLSTNESPIYPYLQIRDNIYPQYQRLTNKSLLKLKIILVDLSDNKIIRDSTFTFKNKSSIRRQENQIINLTRQDSDMSIYNNNNPYAILFLQDKQDLKPKKLVQKYLDNQNNKSKHCFFDPLIQHYNMRYDDAKTKKTKSNIQSLINKSKYLKNKYNKGVKETDIPFIADELQVNIVIKDLFNKVQFKYINNNKYKTFFYINTYKNHLETSLCENSRSVINIQSQSQMRDILNNNKYAIYSKNERLNILNRITTCKHIYQYTNPTRTAIKEHINSIKGLSIDAIKNPFLTDFLRSGINVCSAINYKKHKKLDNIKYIDQQKSYVQFKNCNYYQGFPNKISQFRKVDIKSSDIKRFLKQNQGVFRVKILNNTNLPPNVRNHFNKLQYCLPHKKYSLTSPELIFIHDLGIQFVITHGAYSTKTYHLNVTEQMLTLKEQLSDKEKPTSMYKLLLGRLGCVPQNPKIYTKVSKEMAENIIYNENYPRDKISYINNELSIEQPSFSKPHFVQLFTYITAYSRIQVLQQLIKFNVKDVIRMNLDGMYVIDKQNLSNEDFKDKYLDNTFVIKPFDKIHEQASDKLFSNYLDDINLPTAEYREFSTINFNLGPGGSGKTFYNITDEGLIDTLFVAPSWKLATSKRDEYLEYKGLTSEEQSRFPITSLQKLSGQDGYKYEFKNLLFHTLKEIKSYCLKDFNVTVSNKEIKNHPTFKDLRNTVNKYSCKPYFFDHGYPANIIIDECSMISSSRLNVIISQYSKNSNIILCGDINYQLNPISGDTIKINDYDCKHVECFTEDYRSKDDIIKNLKLKLREYITDLQKHNITVTKERRICAKVATALIKDKTLQTISPENVKHIYDYKNDIILCRTHREKDEWNVKFKDQSKYYVTRPGKINGKYYNSGEIIIDPSETPSNITKRHGFTVHSIQGETFTGRIFIDIREQQFDFKMFYTAISRAKKINQLYLII